MSVYTDRETVEKKHGEYAVKEWADMDNDDDAVKIQARIDSMIEEASNDLDMKLRGSQYAVPFNPVPPEVEDIVALFTGVLLYEARGIKDFNPTTGAPTHNQSWKRKRYEDWIRNVRAGVVQLSVAPSVSTFPQAISDE